MDMKGRRQGNRSGALLIVCAPSGAGKSTLIAKLREEFPEIAYSISCTTRVPREGERDGIDYLFLSKEEFLRKRNEGYFAESAFVHGNWYGTPLPPLRELLLSGHDVVFDIDVQGAAQLRLSLPGGLYVFILPPSMQELERRLRGRGTESEDAVIRRLENARGELRLANWFDDWIVNDDLERAYAELRAAYVTATLNPMLKPCLVTSLLEEN